MWQSSAPRQSTQRINPITYFIPLHLTLKIKRRRVNEISMLYRYVWCVCVGTPPQPPQTHTLQNTTPNTELLISCNQWQHGERANVCVGNRLLQEFWSGNTRACRFAWVRAKHELLPTGVTLEEFQCKHDRIFWCFADRASQYNLSN